MTAPHGSHWRAGRVFIDTGPPPVSSAVQVAALSRSELLLEVEAFAIAQEGTEEPS